MVHLGRGSSNQSNQGAKGGAKTPKSNHGEQTGGKTSEPRNKKKDENDEIKC